jgi:glutaredoxin
MQYKIYTMPHCDKCETVKSHLKSANISFEVVDLGDDEGVAELRKIYPKLKDKVKRTEDGQLPIPLFISFDNDSVIGVANTVDEVKSIIN